MSLQEERALITNVYTHYINQCNVELFRRLKAHQDVVKPIFPLIEFIIERMDTVMHLATEDRVWDAEIVERSAQEALLKLIFIVSAKGEEQEARRSEFWNDLGEINRIKQSEQAKKNLAHSEDNQIFHLAFTPLILSQEEEIQLREKWPAKKRKALEQKWSFSEIIKSLSKDYGGVPMEIFTILAHPYRMSSHLIHGDETGILIIAERNSRNPIDKENAYMSHFCRLISDVFYYCSALSISLMNSLNEDKEFFFKNLEEVKAFGHIIDKYHNAVFNDPDYDQFRKK